MTVTSELGYVEGSLLKHFPSVTLAQTRACCEPHFTEEETEAEWSEGAG